MRAGHSPGRIQNAILPKPDCFPNLSAYAGDLSLMVVPVIPAMVSAMIPASSTSTTAFRDSETSACGEQGGNGQHQ
jgi:hypothetical protein